MTYLEEIGAVKTARREAESLALARALLRNEVPTVLDQTRLIELSRKNKVLLRAARILKVSSQEVEEARAGVDEAFELYELMSKSLEENDVSFVVIKSFDSLPDIGHDLDFLVPSSSDFKRATDLLLGKFNVSPQQVTACDMMVGKFSCFLPGFKHDFELYPTVSQLGEWHFDPGKVLARRKKGLANGRPVWLTSDSDRVIIRIVHAMFRHNFLKLSDVIDFVNLVSNCDVSEVVDAIDRAGIGDASVFFFATIERFLKACDTADPSLTELMRKSEARFGKDRLGLLRRDRLVLPYRIPLSALLVIYLLKAGREISRGRLMSSLRCLMSPVVIGLDFFSNAVLRKRIW